MWWLANMEYEHLKLWLLCCYFCYCHLLFLSSQVHIPYYYFEQVVCPNILKCHLITPNVNSREALTIDTSKVSHKNTCNLLWVDYYFRG